MRHHRHAVIAEGAAEQDAIAGTRPVAGKLDTLRNHPEAGGVDEHPIALAALYDLGVAGDDAHSRRPRRARHGLHDLPSASVSTARPPVARRPKRGRAPMATTKLRVVVQAYPDGPGLYGLQVRVGSRGIRRNVAGTTNKDGEFLCELPVQADMGLTYDVDVTWPRDYGGEVERKSITVNADRTHFVLPFYRTLKA